MTQSFATKGDMAISNAIPDSKQSICNHEVQKINVQQNWNRNFAFLGPTVGACLASTENMQSKLQLFDMKGCWDAKYKEHDAIENCTRTVDKSIP